jgi:hypothetical protein
LLALVSLIAVGSCGDDSVGIPDPGDPADAPLIEIDALDFVGAFRLPATTFGASSLNYSEGPIEVVGSSLFIVGHAHHQAIAEFTIPPLVRSDVLDELEMAATPRQPFTTILARAATNPESLDRIGGLRWIDGPAGPRLLVNAYEYYDAPADNRRTTLVVRDPTDLASSDVDGFYALDGAARTAGWMSDVPDAWQNALGGPLISGASSGIPIISRTSVGPSAFAFDPGSLIDGAPLAETIPTRALLAYNLSTPLHDDLSNGSGSNGMWTHLSRAVFGFIVPGTSTYLTLGHSGGHGPGGVCYKCIPQGRDAPCGGYCARDPDDNGLFYWAYDVSEMAAVAVGDRTPESLRPYASGPFLAPFGGSEMGGGAYDADSGRLYLTMQRADRDQGQYANPPVVVVFEVR